MPRRSFVAIVCMALAFHTDGFAQSSKQTPPPSTQPSAQASTQPEQPRERLFIADEKFELEIAADASSREKGFMHRERIGDHAGMLFIYPETQDELGFWMKNCPIDIDILYLDAKGRIVATHAMKAEPPKRDSETETQYEDRLKRYPSRRPAQFAIELKAGTIERLKIEPGQSLEMDVKRLTAMAE
jgi:uncharacterized membrane protein (UPF0127 family)